MSPSAPREAIDLLALFHVGQHDSPIDRLLADIPALSVGLLGFATLTFFMILRKAKLAPFLLLASVLFTFFAAILDLARLSLDHGERVPNHIQTDTTRIRHQLRMAREVLSSIASCLRFLYFWAFVAQPPLCERGTGSFLSIQHSGSWLRWGLTGTVLRWTTLLASISILVLQIIWRMMRLAQRRFEPVYSVESALEITASLIYIVKLFLNSTLVEVECRRETLWQYSAAFFALLINLGVGLGNLLLTRFSDMPLGRLLLATELYILIVSSMVFSFYTRDPSAAPLPMAHGKRVSAETFFDAGLDLAGEDNENPAARPGQGTSSWLTWNAPQRLSSQFGSSYQDGRRQMSDQEVGRSVNSFPSGERVPSMPPSSVNSSVTEAITRAISEGFSSPTTIPIGSMYNNGKLSTLTAAAMTTSPDSPTLPPDRISEAEESNRSYPRTNQPSDRSNASSGFENLLREQKEKELDMSIAALRGMFAPGQSGEEVGGKSPSTASDLPERSRLRESSTTAYGPTSASNRSEFSLSVFPDPPEMPPITASLSRKRPQVSTPEAVTPTQLSYSGEQAFPVSTGEGDDVAISTFGHRTVSAGTRYDVTSFIGDLSSPDPGSAAKIAMYLKGSDSGSEADSADLATIVTVERKPSNAVISRPHLVEKSALVPEDPISPSSSTPARPPPVRSARDPPSRQRSPTSDLRRSPPPSRAPSARALVTPGGRIVGLPPHPKLDDRFSGDQQMGNTLSTAVYEKR